MKRFILFSILIPLLSFTAKEWVTISPDSHTTLSFPDTPKKSTEGVALVWKAFDAKTEKLSAVNCILSITELSKMGMTAEKMTADLNKPTTVTEFGKGILTKFKGGKIITQHQTSFAGYPAFEYTINIGSKSGSQLTLLHTRIIFSGTTMYNLSVYEAPAKLQEAFRNRFFNSFMIGR